MLSADVKRDEASDDSLLLSEGGNLPSRLRLLCVGSVEPSWINLTLQLDREGCFDPVLKWVATGGDAIGLLRDEGYDCLILRTADHDDADELLQLVRGIRSSGCDDPMVVILPQAGDAVWIAAHRAGADLLVTTSGWESLAIVATVRRALQRVQVERENHRLATADHRRLVRERDEAEHLLNQQRQIVQQLVELAHPDELAARPAEHSDRPAAGPASGSPVALPPELDGYYQELLRTYVIMGSGNLGPEIAKLAELLALAGLTPRQALELHLERVEQLVRGLGNRSTRHVMARADLLALELMIHLGECYQRKTQNTPAVTSTPRQSQFFRTPREVA